MEVNTLDMAQYLIANSPHLARLSDRRKKQLETELAENISKYMRRLVEDMQAKQAPPTDQNQT